MRLKLLYYGMMRGDVLQFIRVVSIYVLFVRSFEACRTTSDSDATVIAGSDDRCGEYRGSELAQSVALTPWLLAFLETGTER